ncbi:hypothetical protein BDM02DRAFT_3123231 [Thelephora ganbajun]|uniref:Uncharacterized protein n=1 Tax=Thelephora ganbajun TaxID=370292 RepID=A0ACB6Z1M9_THEGA|nr:hypothetical protein BDM02DRAFT_3123231 [Thelephora ganbajun]
MFAQTAVFFLALVAFVNSMPITEHHPINLGPGPVPWNPTEISLPGGERKIEPIADATWKRETPLYFGTDGDIEILKSPPATSRPPPPPHGTGGGKGPVELELDFDAGVNPVLSKRGPFSNITNFFRRLGDSFVGRGGRVKARSVVIDPEVLTELHTVINTTVGRLRTAGMDSVANGYLDEVNSLWHMAESGAIPISDLVRAVHGGALL